MKRIEDNWSKIEEYEKKAKIQTKDPEAGFHPNLFFMGGERQILIPVKYRGKKGKKGQEQFTKSYKELSTVCLFCPYTGKPLYEESEKLSNESI